MYNHEYWTKIYSDRLKRVKVEKARIGEVMADNALKVRRARFDAIGHEKWRGVSARCRMVVKRYLKGLSCLN